MALIGVALMIVSPIIGILPGPGFIIVFPIGLIMTLQNSRMAKRLYVRFKRRFPKYGQWTDMAMRRERKSLGIDDPALDSGGEAAYRRSLE
ncbi:MAG: hypothetical protein U5J78_07745 [Parasphingorhabdus sp.]|nr:hypothetical protein [Parasphingorhabdus sp.]